MMKTISDLPDKLVAEILSRIPMNCLGSVRSTCKKWNALSRNWIVGKKSEAKNQFLGFMTNSSMICSVRIDLQGIRKVGFVELSIKHILKEVEVYKAYYCDGLLLLWILNSNPGLVAWNPYLGQTRLIQPISNSVGSFALGYGNDRNHKILHILDSYQQKNNGFNIYEFRSDSWRVLDLTLDVKIDILHNVTLKGNAYFYAEEKEIDMKHFLFCFDFTSERFGPRLFLPFDNNYAGDDVILSCVRDKQLAVLLYQPGTMEIWITNKIDYNEVLWTKWMQVQCPSGYSFINHGNFFIDEEEKVAVVYNRVKKNERHLNLTAHIIGKDGYFKSINVGEYRCPINPDLFGYFPSLVEIQ